MSIKKLADNLYISAQLKQNDIAELAAHSIQTVICNRPDSEEPGQPDFAQVRQWLNDAGIHNVIHQPATMPTINTDSAAQFAAAIQNADAPVLAFCRSGTRSSLLWAIHQAANGSNPQELINRAAAIGIDLTAATAKIQAAYVQP